MPASPDPRTLRASFSALSLYRACPLKYRWLEVDRLPEPPTPPDWRRAPAAAIATVASELDRGLGAAVHRALVRWQRRVDGGATPKAGALMATVEAEAAPLGAMAADVARALARLEPGLTAYAEGPWPRRATLFLEQRVTHVLTDRASGVSVQLALRVDRVVRYRRHVAILDFKTVPPHAFELAADEWQLRTYALAAPELLGVNPTKVELFLVDLRSGGDVPVSSTAEELAGTARELLHAAGGIVAADFGAAAAPYRPCWACGFRLTCPSSLAPEPPRSGAGVATAD